MILTTLLLATQLVGQGFERPDLSQPEVPETRVQVILEFSQDATLEQEKILTTYLALLEEKWSIPAEELERRATTLFNDARLVYSEAQLNDLFFVRPGRWAFADCGCSDMWGCFFQWGTPYCNACGSTCRKDRNCGPGGFFVCDGICGAQNEDPPECNEQ